MTASGKLMVRTGCLLLGFAILLAPTSAVAATIPGDFNGDGVVNVADIFYLINNLFAGGPPPAGLSDANGDGSLSVADAFYMINYMFAQGPSPLPGTGRYRQPRGSRAACWLSA